MKRPITSLKPRRSAAIYSKYDQTIFLHASKVFASLEHEPRDDGSFEATQKRKQFKSKERRTPFINYQSESDRVLTYTLAYSTLKCELLFVELVE